MILDWLLLAVDLWNTGKPRLSPLVSFKFENHVLHTLLHVVFRSTLLGLTGPSLRLAIHKNCN